MRTVAHCSGRSIRVVLLGNAKVYQYAFPPYDRHDNIRGFDIAVNDRRILLMEVLNGIHDRSKNGNEYR